MLNLNCVDVLKLVKVGLTDDQFSVLVDYLQDKRIETIVVSSNKLTERACLELQEKEMPGVRNLYMGRNKVQKAKIKDQIRELETKYALYI